MKYASLDEVWSNSLEPSYLTKIPQENIKFHDPNPEFGETEEQPRRKYRENTTFKNRSVKGNFEADDKYSEIYDNLYGNDTGDESEINDLLDEYNEFKNYKKKCNDLDKNYYECNSCNKKFGSQLIENFSNGNVNNDNDLFFYTLVVILILVFVHMM